jgi:hypothetical protein
MLMIVPLMIWSARMVIDSHACRSETSTPVAMPASTPMRSAGVAPKTGDGSADTTPAARPATRKPTKAEVSIMPSMPMFTTPERSFMIPHRAPKASGVARPNMIGP